MMSRSATLAAFLAAGCAAWAQTPSTSTTDTLYLTTKVGSMKLIDGMGTIKMNFKGTVLVSQLDGTITPSGAVKLEYDAHGRKAYFGQGSLAIQGTFRAIQWFGQNLDAQWTGRGMARLMGEFDDKLETGWFWYSTEPKKSTWYSGGRTIHLPDQRIKPHVPVERGKG